MAHAVSAQVNTDDVKTLRSIVATIPSEFSFDGESKVIGFDYFGDPKFYYVYDSEFNETVLTLERGPVRQNYYDYSISYTVITNICFTQTLFNDDEEYEFVEGIVDPNNSGNCKGFRICSGNKILQEVYFPEGATAASSSISIIKFGDNNYLEVYLSTNQRIIYRITKSNAARIVEQKNISKPLAELLSRQSKIYDMSGKQLPSAKAGMNIIKAGDGSTHKVMMK